MEKTRVLFVCIRNSARSQIAEAFANFYGEGRVEAESAGLEPGKLNPVVVEAMRESGIDISRNKTKGVIELLALGRSYDYVVTVCDESQSERCPIFPGGGKKLHWGFPDPSSFTGSPDELLAATRLVRDAIAGEIRFWLESLEA